MDFFGAGIQNCTETDAGKENMPEKHAYPKKKLNAWVKK